MHHPSLLGLLLLMPLFASPTVETHTFGLQENIDEGLFDDHPGLRSFINTINTSVLGEVSYTYTHENIEKTLIFQVSNTSTLVNPLVGYDAYISSFSFNDTQSFVELFNPTLGTLSLDDYRFNINDTNYFFLEGLSLLPLSAIRVPVIEGVAVPGTISSVDPIIIVTPVTRLWLLKRVDTFALFDTIPLTPTIETRYGSKALASHVFQRHPRTLTPAYTYDPNEWIAYDTNETLLPFALAQPTVTPLEQAKAWATYVMFGAGMNAAGRVEEAFRELEAEYESMDDRSQAILFEEPNTSFQGINERNRLDTSTFREAVGRYNYLAARVPGATGLINPNPSPFPVNSLIFISLGLVGLFAIFAFIKSRYQRA
jgi:hypothetical protein